MICYVSSGALNSARSLEKVTETLLCFYENMHFTVVIVGDGCRFVTVLTVYYMPPGTIKTVYYVPRCIQTPWTPESSLCESRTARRSTRYIVVVRCSSLRACWSISVEHSAHSSQEPQSDSYNFHAPS